MMIGFQILNVVDNSMYPKIKNYNSIPQRFVSNLTNEDFDIIKQNSDKMLIMRAK